MDLACIDIALRRHLLFLNFLLLCGQFLYETGCSRRLNPWSLLSHALSTLKPWRPQCICVICQMFLKFVISLNQGEKKRRFYVRVKNVQTWRQAVGFSDAAPADLKTECLRACSNPKVHPRVKYMVRTLQTWLAQSISYSIVRFVLSFGDHCNAVTLFSDFPPKTVCLTGDFFSTLYANTFNVLSHDTDHQAAVVNSRKCSDVGFVLELYSLKRF